MSENKNDGLDQYGAEPSEQQQFATAGAEGVNSPTLRVRVLQRVNSGCEIAKRIGHRTETVVAIMIPACSKSRSTTGRYTGGISDEDIDVLFILRQL